MNNLKEKLSQKTKGLHYGNRVLIPFRIHVLKAIIENDIITDFSTSSKGAEYFIRDSFTEIYFHDYKSLDDVITKYETIKMVCVEDGNDIFDFDNHVKVCIRLKKNHTLILEEPGEDMLMFE